MSKPDRPHDSAIFSVSQITFRIQKLLESNISPLWVLGEISNFRSMDAGHFYFTLKDEASQIPCVMFRSAASLLRFRPENGMRVRVFGTITVFAPQGKYQIQVQAMEVAGQGELHLAFERLKAKLAAEGLFDPGRKRPLPRFPRKIGVVTSETGAAIQDIRNIISRRYPLVKLLLYSVRVQGEGAAQEIAGGIRYFSDLAPSARPDLLIVGRGGGSIEDLWAFNEEIVARSIAASLIPIVSAVGHEIDFTIADFVADYRAPTPSGAAEIVVPDITELRRFVYEAKVRIHRALRNGLTQRTQHIAFLNSSGVFRPLSEIHNRLLKLDLYHEKLVSGMTSGNQQIRRNLRKLESALRDAGPNAQLNQMKHRIEVIAARLPVWIDGLIRNTSFHVQFAAQKLQRFNLSDLKHRLDLLDTRLRSFDPRMILKRGYSICSRDNGSIVQSYSDVKDHETIRVELSEGQLECEVTDRRFV